MVAGGGVRIVGIVPAAGYATRLQPLSCSKEVYPVAGKPVMDHLVERMRIAGCAEIRVVTRPEKHDVIANSRRHSAVVVPGRPRSLADSIAIGCDDVPDDDIALLGFPDSLWEPVDGFVRLATEVTRDCDVALGVFDVVLDQPCDAVDVDDRGCVRRIRVKAQSPGLFWGCAAARVEIFRAMGGWDDPGYFLDDLSQRIRIPAIRLSDRYLDIGTPRALRDIADRDDF